MTRKIIIFFQELITAISPRTDRQCQVCELTECDKNKHKNVFSLAEIYAQGSSVMSPDTAIAYAMYYFRSRQQVKDAAERAA